MNRRIGALLILGALAGCDKEAEPAAPVRPVLYVEVKPQTERQLGRFAGSIQARYETTLGFRVPGRIARRLVDVGSQVEAGTALATLDPTDQQNALRASEGDLARAQAQLINAQADAKRQQELFARGVGAKANLEQAQTQLSNALSNRDQAKASASQSRDRLGYSSLTSDFTGVVTAWHAEAGQVVAAGQEVVTLARPEVKEAVFDLPLSLADGLDADVRYDIVSQLDPTLKTRGQVREVEPRAESGTRTRRVRLSLDETPEALRLGTSISVSLSRPMAALSVLPVGAVQTVDGKTRVWVIDAERSVVHPRVVQVVTHDDGLVSVAGGLQAGEKVVRAGVNDLRDGQAVKLGGGVQP
ncbi:efflux RND transporter periplasmic adaptor subunit [Pseudomonas sp. LRF_L74]|uniref:efflux RND transporter periplasmic adaptor subunit n=1 Tax=Pseudomonas sp. LRF_L74 TaxID=3369422 RepID=UPI003F625334